MKDAKVGMITNYSIITSYSYFSTT